MTLVDKLMGPTTHIKIGITFYTSIENFTIFVVIYFVEDLIKYTFIVITDKDHKKIKVFYIILFIKHFYHYNTHNIFLV